MLIPSYQNRQDAPRRSLRKWISVLSFLLLGGLIVSILLPSCERVNRAVYPRIAMTVTDAKTGRPIAGASITFDGDEYTPRWNTTTDAAGTAEPLAEMIKTGTMFGPIYTSVQYSAEGIPLKIEASGYSTRLVQIPDQKEWTLLGVGTRAQWRRMSVSLEPATTAPASE